MGVKPWPANGDATADRFAFFKDGLFAGEENGLLIVGRVVYDMCAVKS